MKAHAWDGKLKTAKNILSAIPADRMFLTVRLSVLSIVEITVAFHVRLFMTNRGSFFKQLEACPFCHLTGCFIGTIDGKNEIGKI
jgi:hypothetical protein